MKAEYIDHMGDDLRVVNAARVSFAKESEWTPCVRDDGEPCECFGVGTKDPWAGLECDHLGGPGCLSQADTKLIKYLAKHNHWTPFSHVQITMRETVPIFVARQRFKHIVGFTYNEVSRRYVSDEPEFFRPTWRVQASNVKQGSGGDFLPEAQKVLNDHYADFLEQAEVMYAYLVDFMEVAPEQARMVLPQSMMTSYYVTGSLAAFARAYRQRSDSHSQKEIRDLAVQWDAVIRPLFPVSWDALVS